jgi:leader peptidase (prepilin peptidase)/N-methyltransferase
METILAVAALAIMGAALGSFAVASVWRLRAWQLASEQASGEKLTKAELVELDHLEKLRGKSTTQDRSMCLHCGRALRFSELIPIFSWLWLRGKCRSCKKPIGKAEFIAEVGLALAVAVSFMAWPYGFAVWQNIAMFAVWIGMLTILTIHLIYDAKWFLLLDVVTAALLGLAVVFVGLSVWADGSLLSWSYAQNVALSLVILPGFYGVLYALSKGRWIGFGDVKLLVPLALLLASWPHALLMLFLANVLGCLWILPGMATKKVSRMTRIPFGPFLIVGFFITFLWGDALIKAYLGTLVF